jgi:hypothetical protein
LTFAWSTQAHGINDNGSLIVGEYQLDGSGVILGFILNYAVRQTPFQVWFPPIPVDRWWANWSGAPTPWPVPEPAKSLNSPLAKRQSEQRKGAGRKSRKP